MHLGDNLWGLKQRSFWINSGQSETHVWRDHPAFQNVTFYSLSICNKIPRTGSKRKISLLVSVLQVTLDWEWDPAGAAERGEWELLLLISPASVSYYVQGRENSSSTLQGLPARLRLKFIWDGLTEGKKKKVLLRVHRGPVMTLTPKEMIKIGSFCTF